MVSGAQYSPTVRILTAIDRGVELLLIPLVIWLLLVGLWSGPALGATLVYPTHLLRFEAFLAICLLWLSIREKRLPWRIVPFLLPCLGLLALCALATLARTLAHDGEFDWLRLWINGEPMLRGALICLAVAGRPSLLRIGVISALMGLALLALSGVVQHVTGVSRWYNDLDKGWATGFHKYPANPNYTNGMRVQGLTSYINLTAALLASAFPLWLSPLLLRFKLANYVKVLLLLGAIATAAALWYTNSRGPAMAVIAVGFGLLWLNSVALGMTATLTLGLVLTFTAPTENLPMWAALTLLLALISGILMWRLRLRWIWPLVIGLSLLGGLQTVDAFVLKYPLNGWRVSTRGIEDTARTKIYQLAFLDIETAPLWGVGNKNFAKNLVKIDDQLATLPVTQQNAHNQYLHWAATEGIPVALAFTGLLLWLVIRLWLISRQRQDLFARTVGMAIAAGLMVFLLCNISDAQFWRIEGGGFFWSLLGLAEGAGISAIALRESSTNAAALLSPADGSGN